MEASRLLRASQVVGADVYIVGISHTLGAVGDSMDTSQLVGASRMVGESPQPECQRIKEQHVQLTYQRLKEQLRNVQLTYQRIKEQLGNAQLTYQRLKEQLGNV